MDYTNIDELKEYVSRELERILPQAWELQYRLRPDTLTTSSTKHGIEDHEWRMKLESPDSTLISDYRLRITGDLKWFHFIWGNSDAGSPSKCLQFAETASIFEVRFLRFCSLGDTLVELMQFTRPNLEGIQ